MKNRIVLVERGAAAPDLAQVLQDAACDIVRSDTIAAGLRECHAQPPDLLLVQDDLLDADAVAALLEARNDRPLAGMLVVALVSSVDAPASEPGDGFVDGFLYTQLPAPRLCAQLQTFIRRKQTADASRTQRHHLTRIFQRAAEAMLLVAPASGDILLANPAAANLFGVGPTRLVGKRFRHADAIGRSEQESVEIEIERSGGAPVRFASMRSSLIDRPGGRAYLVSLHDVTESREARSRLDESEQRYRSLFDQNMDAVYSVRPDGSFTSANLAFEQLTGYSSEEIARLGCAQVVAPEWATATLAQFRRTMAGEAVRYHTVGVRKDGSHFEADIKNLPIVIDGRVSGVYGIIKDVTERNAIRRAQRDGEQRLATLFAQAATGLSINSLDGRFIDANPAYCRMLGYTLAELQDTDLASVTHPDDRSQAAEVRALAIGGEMRHFVGERRMLHRNGSTVWARVSVTVLCDEEDQPQQLVGIVEDITDRHEVEQALHGSRALLGMAGRVAQIGAWSVDVPTLELRWSDNVSEIDRPSPFALTVEQAFDHYVPEHRPRVREAFARCIEAGIPFDVEVQVEDEAGRRWVRVIGEAERDQHGRIAKVQGAFQHIDARKQTELQLRQKLFRLALMQKITHAIAEHQDVRNIFGVLCDSVERDLPATLCAVATYDDAVDELRVEYCSPTRSDRVRDAGLAPGARLPVEQNGLSRAAAGHLVYEPALAKLDFSLPRRLISVGLNSLVIAPLAFESRVFGVLIAAREDVDGFISGDCEFLQQLAEHAALATHEAQLFTALQQAYEDLKRSQAEAIDQERLRALAQMAGGVAHDINNAISPITLYVDSLIESERNLSTRARDQLETIRLAIGDVAESVARMRSFARPDAVLRRAPTSINGVVGQVLQLTEARWLAPSKNGGSIRLVRELDPSLPEVATAESEVREALTNLVINALDAMPSGGTLTLRTHTTPATPDLPLAVCIEVDDTGIGMDEMSRQRCLEPYFTTKGEGGTGLGLTMVSLTMRRHGGELEIDSRLGQGTRMRLSFPVPTPPLPCPADQPAAPRTAPLRLLLIDDDPMMRRSLSDILGEEGHQVQAAKGGREGVEAFAAAVERLEPFDAVITDLGMPDMDGRRVAQMIKAQSPSTPVLMLTGWGRRMQDEGERPDHVDILLSKPPRIEAIRDALGRCMAARRRDVR